MPDSNYITAGELARIVGMVRYVNQSEQTAAGDLLGFEVKVFDANGETLGLISMTDGGVYGFYPETSTDATK